MGIENDWIRESVLRDMSEGVMAIGLDGRIAYLNPAAEAILGLDGARVLGMRFAAAFFGRSENDEFNQTVLDAIYDPEVKHTSLAPYDTGAETRRLSVLTSLLKRGGEKAGVIVVISDITELAELKIRYAEQITVLLDSMVRALSTAIDERSPYNANHTRNMVRMGEAFLNWLERQEQHPLRFDEQRRRAFLMSVWLHDVGKLAVPLEIMDKATRLGPNLERVEARFEKIHLLDRVAALEGRISEREYLDREAARADQLAFIRRVNAAGYLPDEDFERVRALGRLTYTGEDGAARPLLTAEELADLTILRGTLTADERRVMQSHATVTGRILAGVDFPEAYAMVPKWAAAHHELLGGVGYPNHLQGDEIPLEVRLLTILDIFEALTARDRPYKKPMPLEKALSILGSMRDEGSLDGELIELFIESRAWENII